MESALPPTPESVLRTPEARFRDLPDFPYLPRYTEIGGLRIAHLDEGPAEAPPVLLLHGEPTWSFLYRHMIPRLVAAGHRVVVPDLVGCGRSDKPARQADYSYARHVAWMAGWLEANQLRRITLFCQDWGSLIGLRLVAAQPERFDRVVLSNGGLPTGEGRVPRAFALWRNFARWSPWFPIGRIVASGCVRELTRAERAAYDAPFPSRAYTGAVRSFPGFVPVTTDDPAREANLAAWRVLGEWHKPFLTLFGSRDPITRGQERVFQKRVPGAKDQPHEVLRKCGHFIQEDAGPELATRIDAFIRANPVMSGDAPSPSVTGPSAGHGA